MLRFDGRIVNGVLIPATMLQRLALTIEYFDEHRPFAIRPNSSSFNRNATLLQYIPVSVRS